MSRSRPAALSIAAAIVVALLAAPACAYASGVAPGATRAHRPMIGVRPTIPPVGTLGVTALTVESTSSNWAGYAVQTAFPTGQTNSISDVKATWVVPTVLGGTVDAYAANWIGIDGYSSSTVEQIGTEQDWTRGVGASYSAWYEMFPGGSVPIPTLDISPGDVMVAEVSWLSSESFRLSLHDDTNGQTYSIVDTVSGPLRSSAEWIVEAPSDNVGVLPFTNLGPSVFTSCAVTVNGVAGPISGSRWRSDPITFVDGATHAALAVPSALSAGGAGFTVTVPALVDSTPPSTTSDAVAGYDNVATIRLTAADNVGGSGVALTYYQVDGLLTQTGTTVKVSSFGPHTLSFWSVDNAGNMEAHHSVSFTVRDTIAPATVSDAQPTYPAAAAITLSAADNVGGSGVALTHYVLDGGPIGTGTFVGVSTAGVHTLSFWSVDNAGNVEPTHTVTFGIDMHRLAYIAGTGGTILGPGSQLVAPGASGTTVTAAPLSGYRFVGWSDGATTATRLDANVSADATFTATFAALPKATSVSLSASTSSLSLGRYVTLTSRLSGGVPTGTTVRYEARKPGSSTYVLLATRSVSSTGGSSYRYKPGKRGTYYFRVRFVATTRFKASVSASRRVRVN